MRIDETGEDIFPLSLDHLTLVRRNEILSDLRDRFVFAENIRDVAFAHGHDFAVADQERHSKDEEAEKVSNGQSSGESTSIRAEEAVCLGLGVSANQEIRD